MSEEDIIFEDAEAYTHKSEGITFKDLILQHLKRITIYCTDENPTRYISAIRCLSDLLYPHFDNEMKEKEIETLHKIRNATQQDETVLCTSEMLRHLSSFLFRKKYFEVGTITD